MNRNRHRAGRCVACAATAAAIWAAAVAAPPFVHSATAPAALTIHYIEATPDADRAANRTLAYFTVLDDSGAPMLDLAPGRFQVLEDGAPVEADEISVSSDPMAVVLAIDTSGSMLAQTPSGVRSIDAVKEAAATFISLLSEGDRVALFTFDNETALRLDFTADHEAAVASVRRISARPQAFTRLYDTAMAAVKKAAELPRGRRAVILFTDGKDEKKNGQPYSIHRGRDVVDAAATRSVRVPIYTIGAGPRVDAAALGRISKLTGGRSLLAASATEVAALYRTTADQLKHPYRLRYFSRGPSGEHSLVIKCRAEGRTVQDERRFWSPPLPMPALPDLEILSPEPEQPIIGDPTVTIDLSPGHRVSRIRAYVDGRLIMDKDQAPLDRFLLSTRTLAPGRHLLRVEALTVAGAMGSAEIPIVVPKPAVAFTLPTPDQPVSGTVALGFEVESEAPVAAVRFRVDGAVKVELRSPPFETVRWDTNGLPPGGHTVQVEVVDAYGRSGVAEAIFQVGASSFTRLAPYAAVLLAAGLMVIGYLFYRTRGKAKTASGTPETAAPAQEGRGGYSGPDSGDDETVFFSGPVDADAAPPATLTLVKSPGLDPGTTFDIRGSASIGRHERNDIRLADKSVSRKHAEIYFDKKSYFLRDLGSRYGTMVNRHRIALDATALFDGAQIELGPRSTLAFTLRPAIGPDDATPVDFSGGGGENDDTFQVDR